MLEPVNLLLRSHIKPGKASILGRCQLGHASNGLLGWANGDRETSELDIRMFLKGVPRRPRRTEDEITMKRLGTNNKQVRKIKRPSLGQSESRPAIVPSTRGQLADELMLTVCEATGTQSYDVGDRIISQAATAQVWPRREDAADQMIGAISLVGEMAPQNATEAMLNVQMIATNEAALMFISRSTLENQSTEATDANVLRATRLMRLFIQQIETVQKLKGKSGQQRVTVEHFHVHQGGQAIVGSVHASKKEGGQQ